MRHVASILSRGSMLSFLVGWTGVPVLAQTAPAAEDDLAALMELLNTPVTTASKVAQKASDAPATVVVITADQIRRRGYRSLRQVLQDLPDYKVEKRTDPEWYTDYTVRGVNGQDTFVILLDGMKINPSSNERIPVMENYPVHMAKQIEVIYGPASALYGADAVSGVINIISKEIKSGSAFFAESTLGTDGDGMRLANFHGGYDFGHNVKLTVSGQWFYDPLPELDKTWPEYKGFASQRAGGPFENPFAPFPFSPSAPFEKEPAYPEKTRAIYLHLKVDDFEFQLFRNSAKVSSTIPYKSDHAILTEKEFLDQSVTTLGGKYSKQAGDVALQTSITTSRYDLDPNSNFRNAFTDMEIGYKYADSSAFKAEQQATWAALKGPIALTFVGGASYEVIQASPWSTDLQSPVNTSQAIGGYIRGLPLGQDGQPLKADFFPLKYDNTGIYLQGQLNLHDTVSLTLGGRYDYNSRYGTTTNPRAGIVWHLNNRHTFKVLYGSAFLAPSPLLAYGHFGSFFPTNFPTNTQFHSAFWRLPNPGLKPMEEKTLEAGYQGTLGSNFNLSVTVYRTKLTNLHTLVANDLDPDGTHNAEVQRLYPGNIYKGWGVDSIEIRTNLGEQTNVGGTVRLDYLQSFGENRKLTAYAAYSFVGGKVDPMDNGQEYNIGLVSPKMLRAGVEVVFGPLSLSTRYTKVGTQRFASPIGGGDPHTLPGYDNVDLHLIWDINRQVGVFLDGSNVTNQKYKNINHEWDPNNFAAQATELKGIPQDPRRLGLGVKLKF